MPAGWAASRLTGRLLPLRSFIERMAVAIMTLKAGCMGATRGPATFGTFGALATLTLGTLITLGFDTLGTFGFFADTFLTEACLAATCSVTTGLEDMMKMVDCRGKKV